MSFPTAPALSHYRRKPVRQALAALLAVVLALISTGCTSGHEASGTAPQPAPAVAKGISADDKWRPAAHLTPSRNWMNDPNGLVYENGTYHAFYQYNPKGNDWGNMSWGHSTSRDLVHWTEEPVAMEATDAEEIFSGSIVLDTANASGLGSEGQAPMVAVYTSAYKKGGPLPEGSQAQSVAYSLDHGRTWKKYQANPVLSLKEPSPNFRDPKLTWYEPGKYWVMTTVVADSHVVKLYKSTDLLHWDFLSDFSGVGAQGGLWEMPELLEVPVEGTSERRWVMLLSLNPGGIAGGSGMQYFTGEFDGVRFRAEGAAQPGAPLQDHRWVDHGADFYAATTIAGAPGDKPVLLGWMGNWDYAQAAPTTPWRGAMAAPRELSLIRDARGLRLRSGIARAAEDVLAAGEPVERQLSVENVSDNLGADFGSRGQLLDVELEPDGSREAGVVLRGSADGVQGLRISYEVKSETLTVDRSAAGTANFSVKFSPFHQAQVPLKDGKLRLRILLDASSVEVFAQGGATVITDTFFPNWNSTGTSVYSKDGNANFRVGSRDLIG